MDAPYAKAIYKMYHAGIVAGGADHSFNADSSIKRGEVAAVLSRMMAPAARGEFTLK